MGLNNYTIGDIIFEKVYFNASFLPKDEEGTIHLGLTVGVMYEEDSEKIVNTSKVTFIYVGGNKEEESKRFDDIHDKLFYLKLGQVVSFDSVEKGDTLIEKELISLTYENFKKISQSYFDLIGNSDIPLPDISEVELEPR